MNVEEIEAKRGILRELDEVLMAQEFATKNSRVLYRAGVDIAKLENSLRELEKQLICQFSSQY